MRKIVRSSRAERDLLGIWLLLDEHGGSIAEKAIALIERRCEVLRRFPKGGEACPQFGDDMRWYPAGNYVIFYRLIENDILVMRVLDGRRNVDEAFWRDH